MPADQRQAPRSPFIRHFAAMPRFGDICLTFDEIREMLDKKTNSDNHTDYRSSFLDVNGEAWVGKGELLAASAKQNAFSKAENAKWLRRLAAGDPYGTLPAA